MKRIPLTHGKHAIVDDEDYEELNKYKWSACKIGNVWYAYRRIRLPNNKMSTIAMHRQIMGNPRGMDVHHKKNSGLDNRKLNLVICSRTLHNHNHPPKTNEASKYRGVHKINRGRWCARISHKNKRRYVKIGGTEKECALAFDKAARDLYGNEANVNFKE